MLLISSNQLNTKVKTLNILNINLRKRKHLILKKTMNTVKVTSSMRNSYNKGNKYKTKINMNKNRNHQKNKILMMKMKMKQMRRLKMIMELKLLLSK